VAADGGRSLLRKAAGIAFPGWAATRSTLLAEVAVREEPPPGLRTDDAGVHAVSPSGPGRVEVVTTERRVGTAPEPTLAELGAALRAAYGSDFGVHDPSWLTRFTDATRQAAQRRAGRLLLAGDAAHVHGPTGGQGIGLGVEDAVNLGWKLARVARGLEPDTLLDSSQAERHAATDRVLRHTRAVAAQQPTEPVAFHVGLDVDLEPLAAHPLVGRRVPDLDLPSGRLYELLHDARPLDLDVSSYAGPWVLPVVGAVEPVHRLRVRPDGHVSGVG
jgi:3-(3-hydroxy-phenyl)propionate hydroxylase